jgi:2,4-dienoyl-CoA reductase-like NADH-dependent reductase (Old Yellow Enzyme family)
LAQPLTLPCGLALPNRILKAAMAEGLADLSTCDVSPALVRLYERWADGGAGTLVTGNITVRRGPADVPMVCLDERTDVDALAGWAAAVHMRDVRLLGQVVHQGRQATILSARHPVAPSALPPVRGNRLFGSSRALRPDEVVDLVERFAAAAALLERAGFDGVELHAAHGYLIGQFLSPATNLRTDEWGGDLSGRSRFLLEIVRRVRDRVGAGFAVAVKINASDFQPGGFDVEDSAHVVGLLGAEGVDLVEISGGTYESRSGALGVGADVPGATRDSYFAGFAPRLRQVTDVPLALTGGLRSREVMEGLLREGVVDVIGLGRPLVEQPEAPHGLLAGTLDRIEVVGPRSTAAQNQLLWYMAQFQRLGNGQDFDAHLSRNSPYRHLAMTTLAQLVVTGQHALGGLVGRTGIPRVLGLGR